MEHNYIFEKDKLIIDGEEIKISYTQNKKGNFLKKAKTKFYNGTFDVESTSSVIDLFLFFEDDFELILRKLGVQNISLGIDSIEEFLKLVESKVNWISKVFKRSNPDDKDIFESIDSDEEELFMKFIEVYYGTSENKRILRIIDVEKSSFCVCDEKTMPLKTADGLFFKINRKVYRFDFSSINEEEDTVNPNDTPENVNPENVDSENITTRNTSKTYQFLDKKVEIKKISTEKEIIKYIYDSFIEWREYAPDFDYFKEEVNLRKMHKLLCGNIDIKNEFDCLEEEIKEKFNEVVFPYCETYEEMVIGLEDIDWNTHVLKYGSKLGELFDDSENLLPEFQKIQGKWTIKYAANTCFGAEDSETLFVFDCSGCTYEFLKALDVLDYGYFYFIDDKLYLLAFRMLD